MDYHDCRCPPDFETCISRTLSMENEEKKLKFDRELKQLKSALLPTKYNHVFL